MASQIESFEHQELSLQGLCSNLRGLWAASSQKNNEEFEDLFAQLDMELELRTEPWAPPGSPSDERLNSGLLNFRNWIKRKLNEES